MDSGERERITGQILALDEMIASCHVDLGAEAPDPGRRLLTLDMIAKFEARRAEFRRLLMEGAKTSPGSDRTA